MSVYVGAAASMNLGPHGNLGMFVMFVEHRMQNIAVSTSCSWNYGVRIRKTAEHVRRALQGPQ